MGICVCGFWESRMGGIAIGSKPSLITQAVEERNRTREEETTAVMDEEFGSMSMEDMLSAFKAEAGIGIGEDPAELEWGLVGDERPVPSEVVAASSAGSGGAKRRRRKKRKNDGAADERGGNIIRAET